MARYIDAVKAADIISKRVNISLDDLVDVFAEIPTADVEEVKHGEWRILPEDPYDESGAPTEEGWYRIITEDGEETTDYFFNKPTLVASGEVGYWKNNKKLIRAWAKMDNDFKE